MPLPEKSKDEKRGKFISRCMGDPKVRKEFPDAKQRAGVCYSQYDKKKKKQ